MSNRLLLDRSPVEDRRWRRVFDVLGSVTLVGLETVGNKLQPAAPTTTAIGGPFLVSAIADLNLTVSNPPTQAEIQLITDKIDETLLAFRVAGILEW
jgi:hypothetical protein